MAAGQAPGVALLPAATGLRTNGVQAENKGTDTLRILYYDCLAGLSGDMNLAAMLDLGVDPDDLRAELSKLGLDREFRLQVSKDVRNGIRGTRVDVVLTHDDQPEPADAAGHGHGHGDHNHGPHEHGHDQAPHPPHRNLKDIEAIITASRLDGAVQKTSLDIFRRLAAAEARVHGKLIEEVHFHEVGATDSIVDIVGAAICRHKLCIDAVWASPVELGGGFVRCAHGLIPVPAPATVVLLEGIPTTRGATPHETTTPTGAAILASLADNFTATPALVLETTAYGLGHRQTELPNVLRVHLARPATEASVGTVQAARLLECNIDDMTAEMLGVLMDVLMEQGAMDVHFTPILMKKNRPATCVSLLCGLADEARFKELLFTHSTTLGIKSFPLEKTVLDIAFERLDTPLGSVTMKNALLSGQVIRSKPELEECRALAARHGIPLGEVYHQIGLARK
jgi:pyridinium-3,5-bisthiocarboxylic acid mononucleotide nickel chelatase